MRIFSIYGSSVLLTLSAAPIFGQAGFEDLGFAANALFENGRNLSGVESSQNRFGSTVTVRESTFNSGANGIVGNFENTYIVDFDSWSGWAYSRDVDSQTSGFGNQYSSITGSGARGSSNYGIGFSNTSITFQNPVDFTSRGFDVTNTTYAHNSIRDGDSFARQFGDDPSTAAVETDEPDTFVLTVEGFNSGVSTGTLDFYLADYRFTDDSQDFIVDEWTFVDLSSFGVVDTLSFELSTTDVGNFGPNTPLYFAIDNIGVVPESSSFAIVIACSSFGWVVSRNRRSRA